MTEPEPAKISREQANQAYRTIVEAINAAMTGNFPVGLESLDLQVQIKAAAVMLGTALREYYGEPKPMATSDVATEKKED